MNRINIKLLAIRNFILMKIIDQNPLFTNGNENLEKLANLMRKQAGKRIFQYITESQWVITTSNSPEIQQGALFLRGVGKSNDKIITSIQTSDYKNAEKITGDLTNGLIEWAEKWIGWKDEPEEIKLKIEKIKTYKELKEKWGTDLNNITARTSEIFKYLKTYESTEEEELPENKEVHLII